MYLIRESQTIDGFVLSMGCEHQVKHLTIHKVQSIKKFIKCIAIRTILLLLKNISIITFNAINITNYIYIYIFQIIDQIGRHYVSMDRATKFTDLIQLVDFYRVNGSSLPTPLTHYVTNSNSKGSL